MTAGNDYGTAVEAGNRVFVPNYTTGEVLIIDPGQAKIITKSAVLSPSTRFELLTRDSVVFYNDTLSERAGVIQLDGTVLKADKYNPADPQSGLSGPQHNASNPPATPPPGQPAQTGQVNQPGPGTVPSQPAATDTRGSDTTRKPQPPQNPGNTPKPPDPAPPPKDKPDLEITVSKATPVENEAIILQVANKNGKQPASAHWTFGDGAGEGLTTTHQWATAQETPYLVTVTVKMADDPEEYQASTHITVSETPKYRLTVSVPGGGGTVTSADGAIDCPPTCFVDVKKDVQVTLTAQPDAAHLMGSWSGACGGTAASCDVTLTDAPKTATHTFELKPIPKEAVTVTAPNGGFIDGPGGTCPGKCVFEADRGTTITLTAQSGNQDFRSWAGDCSGSQGDQCRLLMNGPKNASANFIPKPYINGLTCNPTGGGRFRCDADAGPREYYEGIRWYYDGLGVARPSTNMSNSCPKNTFDVRFAMAGLERTATVQNCT